MLFFAYFNDILTRGQISKPDYPYTIQIGIRHVYLVDRWSVDNFRNVQFIENLSHPRQFDKIRHCIKFNMYGN